MRCYCCCCHISNNTSCSPPERRLAHDAVTVGCSAAPYIHLSSRGDGAEDGGTRGFQRRRRPACWEMLQEEERRQEEEGGPLNREEVPDLGHGSNTILLRRMLMDKMLLIPIGSLVSSFSLFPFNPTGRRG